jgi:hypothetical protein
MGLSRRDDVIRREVAGEVFLVPIRGRLADLDDLLVLNEVAAWIWDRLDGDRTADDIVAELCAGFDVSADVARGDVRDFIRELAEADLIDGVEEADDGL